MTIRRLSLRWFLTAFTLACLGLSTLATGTGERRLKVQLGWGTDGDKPANKPLEELDPKVREKLRSFRWKNYWVVHSESTTSRPKDDSKVTLSPKCGVKVREADGGRIQVQLFTIAQDGQWKLVKTVVEPLRKGDHLIIGGDDKEKWDDAWFVIISEAP